MRIVGGKWRGQRLFQLSKSPIGIGLRPTTDRVRETTFNILQHGIGFDMKESRVLDLFCGTGALGLEALSRGANYVCFIDVEKTSLNIVNKNLNILGIENEVTLLQRDVTKLKQNHEQDYNLIFLDPPYGKGLGELALGNALERGWISQNATVVWEEKDEVFPPEELHLIKSRAIGISCLNFLKRCN
tara:strand:- start:208 stop:768 length:561 start_codon:yes stop_codon:yes gene_type:complete